MVYLKLNHSLQNTWMLLFIANIKSAMPNADLQAQACRTNSNLDIWPTASQSIAKSLMQVDLHHSGQHRKLHSVKPRSQRKAQVFDVLNFKLFESNETMHSVAAFSFNRCALVGSGRVLKGRGHGQEIDGYDVVIRVNRLPTPEYFADFGQKTHILFANHWEQEHGNISLMSSSRDRRELRSCHSPVCSHSIDCSKGGVDCPFEAMVFRGYTGCNTNGGQYCKKLMSKLRSVWGRAPFPIGVQHPNITAAVDRFRYVNLQILPSTGLEALVTFAPICHSLTVYGMAGDELTVDGHAMEVKHSFALEHHLLDKIADGHMSLHDWPKFKARPGRSVYWLRQHMNNIKVVHD